MRTALFASFLVVAFTSSAFADCLTEVAKFAGNICGQIQTSGGSQLTEADGQLKGEVSGIVRKVLGGASGEVDIKYLQDAYENVLREDLAKELFNLRECKIKMVEAAMSRAEVCRVAGPITPQPFKGQPVRESKLPAYKAEGSSEKSRKLGAQNVLDGKIGGSYLNSWWPRPDDTIETWIDIYLTSPCMVTGIKHYIMLPSKHRVGSQIKSATLSFDDGSRQPISFSYQSNPGWQTINIQPVKTQKLRLTIDEIFPSEDGSQLQVSEFELLGHSCE